MSELLPYQQRVVDEKVELDTRLNKLSAFVESETFSTLPHADRLLLLRQEGYMQKYSGILAERIERFKQA